MKIVLINSMYYPQAVGGAELSVQYLAESLVSAGHQVVVICAAQDSAVGSLNGVKIYYIKLRNLYWPYAERHGWFLRLLWNIADIYNPLMRTQISRVIAGEQPDLVHTNNLQAISVAVWRAASRLRIPIVHTIRDLFLLCPRSAMFRGKHNCERQCFECRLFSVAKKKESKYVDHVVGISRFILQRHVDLGWFPRATTSVVQNSYLPSALVTEGRPATSVRFGYIGRIDARKGIELLLAAFSAPGIQNNSSLLIAGDGEPAYVRGLQSQAAHANVQFAGRLDPAQFFSQIDVAIVPSIIHEALGRVIFEAYAYGKPVIASRRGGIPEIVRHGTTGYLFDPEKSAELTGYMQRFVDDPGLSREFESACRKSFEQFRPEIIAQQYVALYSKITGIAAGSVACQRPVNAGVYSGTE